MQIKEKRSIGLTGGIATGKSLVSSMFEELGAYVIDADKVARDVVERGSAVLKEIERHFGREVILPDGSLNRKRLREIIISDKEKRELLNSITHPAIIERENKLVENANSKLIIVDAALLIESGSYKRFKEIILVYAPFEVQVKRLMERDAMSREDAVRFIKTQMDIEEKKKYATYIIDNSNGIDYTRKQVEELYETLQK